MCSLLPITYLAHPSTHVPSGNHQCPLELRICFLVCLSLCPHACFLGFLNSTFKTIVGLGIKHLSYLCIKFLSWLEENTRSLDFYPDKAKSRWASGLYHRTDTHPISSWPHLPWSLCCFVPCLYVLLLPVWVMAATADTGWSQNIEATVRSLSLCSPHMFS